jgi:hypothetical protein
MSIHWGGRGAGHVSRWSLATTGAPALALDFITTTSLDSRITFTRASTATFVGSNGLIQSAAINAPRFDYDPVTLAPKGLLIEQAKTNLFLNSLINGTVLSTQSVTVTAAAHTISFYGTGTITLSGAATATVVGTGVYPSRQTLTFTPIAGVLVCTVSGSVQYAQIEVGSFATSFIPTGGSTVQRSADVATITGTNFSSWYNQSEGTLVFEGSTFKPTTVSPSANVAVEANDGTLNNRNLIQYFNNVASAQTTTLGSVVSTISQTYIASATDKLAYAYKTNDFAFARNGALVGTDTLGNVPVVNRLALGNYQGQAFLNGHIRQITYYNTRLLNPQLQTLTQ